MYWRVDLIKFFLLFLAIPVIALIDGLILGKHFQCDVCGKAKDWKFYIVPTTLEILLFLTGVAIGSEWI